VASIPPAEPAAAAEALDASARDDLMKMLDRETAIARATQGRLAVLVIELRRVDRLQALLRGPAPSTTMELVLDRLRRALRPEDRLAALGDDQVCVVLPRLAHPSQAVLAAVKLLRTLDKPIPDEGGAAILRPCVGIATVPEHGFDPAGLLMAADVSRQIAATREEGYHVFTAEDAVENQVYRGLDVELERAIRANELELAWQPQVALASGEPVAMEALLRWRHLTAGDVSPATVIGIAERTGLMGQLTFWVLNAALRQLAQWRSADMAPRIAVNVAVGNLGDREFPAVIDQVLKTWSIPPADLVLEIPESAMPAVVEAERQQAVVTRLKGVGVQLAIDDFGSGYTSLAQLRRLPLDELKIDRPYVASLLTERGDAALVRSAIDIAHNFGLRVVAEGAETAEAVAELRRLGCDLAQGAAFGHAMPANVMREWWARGGKRPT